ncbi:hypothetical protein SDC9_179020 [bioreactor metagenome]|uniref:Uncharacterized protein n=1 Tax=bioreactor metagenome TaxID=1076179 RepID=A0A645GZ80_9ZZZZ
MFRLGDTHYQAGWKNYVQENIITLFKANWTGFIREDDGEASLFLWFWKDPDIAAGGFVYKMRAFSSVDVKETVSISGITFRKDGFPFPTYWREFLISIFPGTNEAEITIEIEEGEDFERDIYIGDYTATDGTYSYQLTVFRFEPPIIEKPPIIWA